MTTLLFFRQALAEWRPVWALVRRTRLALWLLIIALTAIGVGDRVLLPTLALAVALSGIAAAAATLAGPDAARVSAMTLRHPASPLALATGRWLAVTGVAAVVTVIVGIGAAWQVELGWREGLGAALSAARVALPVVGCGLLFTAESWRRRAP